MLGAVFAKMLRKLSILSTSLFLFACAPASGPEGRGALNPKPAPLVLPKQTPMACSHYDPNGVLRLLRRPDYDPVYNVFVVAVQANGGYRNLPLPDHCRVALRGVPQYKGDIRSLVSASGSSAISKSRATALSWLITNADPVPGSNALMWHYKFPNAYNDVSTQGLKQWSSAFGQAAVLRAFNKAYQDSRDPKYRLYALRAASAYQLPVANGGFKVPVSQDAWFYEEMPVTPLPFILNGHLVSTVALLETYKLYRDPTVLMMAKKGLNAAKLMLPRYDLGYWSRYDLNPRKGELLFRIRPNLAAANSPGIPVQSITLRDSVNRTTPIDLRVGDSSTNPQVGAWRISGSDWALTEPIDGRLAMLALDNSRKYAKSGLPKGGTSYNSYLVAELPTIRFSSNLEVPRFDLLLTYKDTAKGLLAVDLRDIRNPDASTFIPLKSTRLFGDQKWKTLIVPVQPSDLAWYVGVDYQHWHIKLLNELYGLTGDPFYRYYARRWQCYVDHRHDYDTQLVKYPRCNQPVSR